MNGSVTGGCVTSRAIDSIPRTMGADFIAEGIEKFEQMKDLSIMGYEGLRISLSSSDPDRPFGCTFSIFGQKVSRKH